MPLITNNNIRTLVKQYIETPDNLPAGLKRTDAAGNMVPIPIGEWDVSEVTDMFIVFAGYTEFNEPIENWNVSNVTSMQSMFENCKRFNQPLDGWGPRLGQVTDMMGMFTDCDDFNRPLNSWQVGNVVDMTYMFMRAISFDQPLDQWDMRRVVRMDMMFWRASNFRQDLSGWDLASMREPDPRYWALARIFSETRMIAAYLPRLPEIVPVQPQTIRVDPMQVHRESGKIDYARLNAFYVEKLGEKEIPLPSMFPILIMTSMIQFITTNDDTDQKTLKNQLIGLVQIMNTRLVGLNYEEKSPVLKKAILYTLEYVKRQPPTFQGAYADAFVRDCTTAYEGQGEAAMTCAAGALERVIISVTNAIQTMNSVDQGNPEWNTLLDIITVSPRTKIPELIRAWYKDHKTGEDGRPTAFSVDERNAEGRRDHLKRTLLRMYPREEELIEAMITEIADNIGYENDDFNVQYGGRRRRRRVTRRRGRGGRQRVTRRCKRNAKRQPS